MLLPYEDSAMMCTPETSWGGFPALGCCWAPYVFLHSGDRIWDSNNEFVLHVWYLCKSLIIERWPSLWEHWLLYKGAEFWSQQPYSKLGISQLSATPVPRDPVSTDVHTSTRVRTQLLERSCLSRNDVMYDAYLQCMWHLTLLPWISFTWHLLFPSIWIVNAS